MFYLTTHSTHFIYGYMASYNIITNIIVIIIVTRRRGVRGRCKGHSTGIDVGLTGLRFAQTILEYYLWLPFETDFL